MYRKLLKKLMTKQGIYLVTFLVNVLVIPLFHMPVIMDALNPLALGFLARGDDWRQYLTADGYYYKYGQMLFYFPFVYLIRDNVVLYRVLLLVNALITSWIPVCAHVILIRHLDCADTKKCFMISLLTGVLPIITLNNKCTWAEPVLMVLPWCIMLLLLDCAGEKCSERKARFFSVLLAALQVYAYMVHTRGIVILAASVLCVIVVRIFWGNKNIRLVPYGITTAILLAVDQTISFLCRALLYGSAKELAGGTLSFLDQAFLKKLFSVRGLKIWGEEIMGWLYASVSSTAGLVILGLVASAAVVLRIREWRTGRRQEVLIVLFSVLCFFGALFLGTVFFFDDLYAVSDVAIAKRGDKLIYARYLNGAAVCVSFIGLYYVMCRAKFWTASRLFYAVSLFLILHGFFVSVIAERIDHTVTWLNNLVTISYFCDFSQCIRGGMYSTVGNLSGGIALFSLSAFLFFCTALACRKRLNCFLVLYLTLFLAGYLWNTYNTLYRMDAYMTQLTEQYCAVIESVQGEKEQMHIYLDDEILRCGFQYRFSDYYVLTKRDENRHHVQNMFILSPGGVSDEALLGDDCFEVTALSSGNFSYHIYVKGQELNERLQEKGYVTEKCQIKSK